MGNRLVVIVILFCCGSDAVAQEPGLATASGAVIDEESLVRMRNGDVLLENTRTDESGGSAQVRALFRVPVEQIWSELVSCERAYEYVDGLKACDMLESDREHALIRQSVKKSWAVPRMDFTVEFERSPYSRIEFRKVEGDLELMEGHWLFTSLPGDEGTVVTHNIRVKPRIPVPRWLIRRSIRKDIPDMLACLRSLADGSGSEERWKEDNRRCPRPGRGKGRSS